MEDIVEILARSLDRRMEDGVSTSEYPHLLELSLTVEEHRAIMAAVGAFNEKKA